jgi:hypothetical protein
MRRAVARKAKSSGTNLGKEYFLIEFSSRIVEICERAIAEAHISPEAQLAAQSTALTGPNTMKSLPEIGGAAKDALDRLCEATERAAAFVDTSERSREGPELMHLLEATIATREVFRRFLEALRQTDEEITSVHEDLIHYRTELMLLNLPNWGRGLTPQKMKRVRKLTGSAARLITDKDRPGPGAPLKWSRAAGLILAADVDAACQSRGEKLDKTNEEALLLKIQKAWPDRYGGCSWKTLRAEYYKAKKYLAQLVGKFGTNTPTRKVLR